MLASKMEEITGSPVPNCWCGSDAKITMHCYADNLDLCTDCALQLVRKITEDLCELLTAGGRHG